MRERRLSRSNDSQLTGFNYWFNFIKLVRKL